MSLRKIIPILLAWATVVYLSTLANRLSLGYLSGICGPWGCLAPTGSILSVHLFWLALFSPLVWPASRWLTWVLGIAGAGGLLCRFGWMMKVWSAKISVGSVWPTMAAFSVLSSVEYPFLALCVLCVFRTIRQRFRKPHSVNPAAADAGGRRQAASSTADSGGRRQDANDVRHGICARKNF